MRMEQIRDCAGRLVCMASPEVGLVELKYGKLTTYTRIPVGESYYVERDNIATWITRESEDRLKVSSHPLLV